MFLTKAEVSFESLQIVLNTRGRVLGTTVIENFSSSFSDSDEHKKATLSLDGIWIRDLTGQAPMYPYMIECTKGKKLIDVNVHMRNKELYKASEQTDTESSYLTPNQTPKVTLTGAISGVKLTFLNRFVQEMTNYPNLILETMSAMKPPEEGEYELKAAAQLNVPTHKGRRSRRPSSRMTGLLDTKHGGGERDSKASNEMDRKVRLRMKEWKREKGIKEDDKNENPIFDFYKVDLQLHKIEVLVPQGSKSTNMMVMTLEHIGITNSLCEEEGIPQPETRALHRGNLPVPDISHQQQEASTPSKMNSPPTFQSMLSLRSSNRSALTMGVSSAGSDEFYDCNELKPLVWTKWDIVLNKLQAVSVFENKLEGITRDKPMPLFQIQEPEGDEKNGSPIAARIVAIQNIPQNKLDPSIHPDLFVLMQVATISMIASRIQLQFLTRISSENLAETAVLMRRKTKGQANEIQRSSSGDFDEDDASDARSQEQNDQVEELDESTQAQNASTMKVTVMFNDLVIKLVEDPLAEVSRSLGLAWNIHLGLTQDIAGNMDVQGLLKDVTMFNTVLNKKQSISDQLKDLKTGHYIMDPYDMSLKLTKGKAEILDDDSKIIAKLYGGQVNIRLTYQDYKLVMDSLGYLSTSDESAETQKQQEGKGQASKEGKKLSKVKPKKVKEMKKAWKRQGGYLLDPKKIKEPFVGTYDAMDNAQSNGEQEIVAQFEGINISLVNNVTGIDMQFARFELSRFSTIINGFAHQQRISSRLNFHATYFNQELLAWEPMIEPWNLQADVWKVAGHGTTAKVRTDKPLYINLTKAMVNAVTSALDLVNKVEKDRTITKEGKMIKYSPYMVHNLTEIKVRYSLESGNAHSGDLCPGQQAPLMLDEDESLHIVITPHGYRPVPGYDMNKVGKVEYHLDQVDFKSSSRASEAKGSSKHVIVMENRVIGGIKTLYIHSTVSISNETVVKLVCGSVEIAPGEKAWIPISQAKVGLQLKPKAVPRQTKCTVLDESESKHGERTGEELGAAFAPEDYSFSDIIMVETLLEKMQPSTIPDEAAEGLMYSPHMTVTCLSSSGRSFHLCVLASKYKSSSVTNVCVRAPFVIENVLTCGATIMVSRAEDPKNHTLFSPTFMGTGGRGDDVMSTPLLQQDNETKRRKQKEHVAIHIDRAGSYEMFDFPATQRCMMSLKVDGYADSWSGKVDISSKETDDGPITKTFQLMPEDSNRQMYIHCEMMSIRAHGLSHSRRLALFVPYWIFDATGLELQMSTDKYTIGAINDTKKEEGREEMFANWSKDESRHRAKRRDKRSQVLRAQSIDENGYRSAEMLSVRSTGGGTRVSFRTNRPIRSHWSDYTSLDSAESQIVSCYASTEGKVDPFWVKTRFDIGLVSASGPGKFVRTRMVTLTSRHVIVNNLNTDLEIRQHRYPGSVVVSAGAKAPFHLIYGTSKELVTFRILPTSKGDGDKKAGGIDLGETSSVLSSANLSSSSSSSQAEAWAWTGSFRINEPGDFGLIARANDSSSSFLVRIEIRASDGTLFVVIDREHPKCPPFRIVNKTAFERLRYCQKYVNKWTIVDSFSVSTYSWDQPLGVKGKTAISLEVAGDYKGERTYTMEESGQLDRIVLRNPDRILYVYTIAEGPTKVLVLSDLPNPEVVHDSRSSPEEQRKQEKQLRLLRQVDPLLVLNRRKEMLDEDLKRIRRKLKTLEKMDVEDQNSSNVTKQLLRVTIIEASSVGGVKWHGKSDVYARIYFNHESRQTKVLKHNLNPWFDQTFDFDVTPRSAVTGLDDADHPLQSKFRICLFNKNLVAPADFLGGVVINLEKLRELIKEQKDLQPVQLQRWVRLDSMRHINRQLARVHLKVVWCPSKTVLVNRDKHLLSRELRKRMRCKIVLLKQIRQERRDQGLEEKTLRRKSQGVAPPKQVLFTLKVNDAKLNLFDGNDPGSQVRFQDQDEKKQGDPKSSYRVILRVRHGAHQRMCILHDPDPNVPAIMAQKDDEPFEFYVDEDEVKETVIRLDCFAQPLKPVNTLALDESKKAASASSWIHLGYCRLHLEGSPSVEKKTFEEKAAELRVLGSSEEFSVLSQQSVENEKKEGKDTGNYYYWQKLSLAENSADFKIHRLSGGQVRISLLRRPAPPPEERAHTVGTVSFPEFGVSMIDSTPEEIFFFQVKGMVLAYEDTPVQKTMEASVFRIQLDNCLSNAQFPIVLAPEPMPPSQCKPFLQLSMHQSKTIEGVPVSIYQYCSFLMQKLKLSIEERIMLRMMSYMEEFAKNEGDLLGLDAKGDQDGSDLVKLRVEDLYPIPGSSASKMFFSFLQLHPIAVDISLELSSELRNQYMSEGGAVFNPLKWIRNAAGTAIDIDEAPVRLNALTIEDAYGNTSTLLTPIMKHYTSQVIREAYKVLGSLEILGNPVQLVGNLGEGVMDFFYEPAKGLVTSPQDFGRGLARGTTSLLKHTLTGIFGAASKVTGKLAEGIAVLGMDEEFQRQSRIDARKPPRHLGEGLVAGGKSILMGVYRGVTGIVTDPYHGYRLQGWKGFFKGCGTGVLGVGLKPAAGSIQAASRVLQGIGNTATCCDDVFENERARHPRYIGQDRVIRPYNMLDAMMAAHLRLYEIQDLAISKEEKKSETYIKMFSAQKGNLIISNLRILMIPFPGGEDAKSSRRPKPKFRLLWENVKGFACIANTVVIQRKEGGKPLQIKMPDEMEAIECKKQLDEMLPILSTKKRGKIGGKVSDIVNAFKISIFRTDD